MGFKENLKAELAYKGILIKELAALSGISRRTIDNYLREEGSMPLADAAVRIAGALGVTVEYLFAGREPLERKNPPLAPDPRVILKSIESLNARDRKVVFGVIKTLNETRDAERKAPVGAPAKLD